MSAPVTVRAVTYDEARARVVGGTFSIVYRVRDPTLTPPLKERWKDTTEGFWLPIYDWVFR